MKLLYLDCSMGAAGDMLCAALLELFPHPEEIIDELNTLGIPHVTFGFSPVQKCGIIGTHVSVKIHEQEEEPGEDFSITEEHVHHSHEHAHHHSSEKHEHHSLHQIEHLISHLNTSEKIKQDIVNVYRLLAEAESKVHGVNVSQIHFHEVGNLDAIGDIAAVCVLLNKLAPDKIVASPIHVGSGHVQCAHGILPVPAPATAYLLQNCPIYGGHIQGELCTPTGAALLKYFTNQFSGMPVMTVSSIGYGMGKKDFPAANCIRAMLGTADDRSDEIYELSCNVDDMTAEAIGFALDCFFQTGALEAYTLPVTMKKSRPGTMIQVLCRPDQKDHLIHTMFLHTSTAGIRIQKLQRKILHRKLQEVETIYGTIQRKDYSGFGIQRSKYEYEDLARIAQEHHLSLSEILENIKG